VSDYTPDLEDLYYQNPLETTADLVNLAARQAAEQAASQVQEIKLQSAVDRETRAVFQEAEQRVLADSDVNERSYEARAPYMRTMLVGAFRDEVTHSVDAMEAAIRGAYHAAKKDEEANYWQSVQDTKTTRYGS
jgi:hypothetical protein